MRDQQHRGLTRLGQAVGRYHRSRPSGDMAALRRRVIAATEDQGSSHRGLPRVFPRWQPYALAACTVAACAFASALLWWPTARRSSDGPITVELDSPSTVARFAVGAWLHPTTRPLGLRFSDGSKVTLAARTTARVDRLTRTGAVLNLKDGTAHVFVKPGHQTRWKIAAGPFSVKVVGTSFAIGWDDTARAFELKMKRGEVVLSGPTIGARRVTTGDHVRVRLEPSEKRVGSATEAPTEPLSTAQQTGLASSPPRTQRRADATLRAPEPSTPRRKPALAALAPDTATTDMARHRNDEDRPARPAQQQGMPGRPAGAERPDGDPGRSEIPKPGPCFADMATPAEVLLQAHRARQSHQAARAHDLYLCVRQRFGDSEQAGPAAFGLALTTGDDHTRLDEAARWLRVYLEERPTGPLAAAALGRLLEVQLQRGAHQSAQAVARSYLDRHPEGPHVGLARSTIDQTLER